MVLISHTYKVVFIHIPKNAGSFIKNILRQIDTEVIEIFGGECGHQPFYTIKELSIYNEIKDYVFFCVIREPIDMIISHYNYILTCKNTHYMYNHIKDKSVVEAFDLIVKENIELNLRYIKYNIDEYSDIHNPVNKNIILLNFDNICCEFKNFLIYINVPEEVINKINFSQKVNESIKFFETDYFSESYYFKTIEQNQFLLQNNKNVII